MCHNHEYDLESYEKFIDEHLQKEYVFPTHDEAVSLRPVLEELANYTSINQGELRSLLAKHGKERFKKNAFLIQSLYILLDNKLFDPEKEDHMKNLLRVKRGKSHSGIVSVTVFTSPYPTYTDKKTGNTKTQDFTCQFNCHFCPNQPGQPRSYLRGEPGVMRANRYGFDCVRQVWGRLTQLLHMGHNLRQGKLEIIVSGGTWTSYPPEYREEFIRDIYYAANTFQEKADERRSIRKSLKEEKNINRDSLCCRVIGLTVEFRPDSITKLELLRLRSYGCTRVQLGVQHLDDEILKKINRRCTTKSLIKSLKLLKDCCYKVDIHIMPNLPGSSPEKDRMMMERFQGMLTPIKTTTKKINLETENVATCSNVEWEQYDIMDPDISADQWKLYPCETVPFTEIEKWYREGTYVPYPKDELYGLLYETKQKMYPWIRTNRIIRDIPKNYIIASSDETNMGQMLLNDLKKNRKSCMCIRCRETKESHWDGTYQIVVRQYKASGGDEYFISAENGDKTTLYGFLRLRCVDNPHNDIFPELDGCSLIRELHVYSTMNPVGEDGTSNSHQTVQHRGIGKTLLQVAESITKERGFKNIAVIAGVGVQRYYEKRGYSNDSEGQGDFLIKYLVL
jgi:histone acetyltransferase (RNA polymerase elongator complex component)